MMDKESNEKEDRTMEALSFEKDGAKTKKDTQVFKFITLH
jgi:hypothetical protein